MGISNRVAADRLDTAPKDDQNRRSSDAHGPANLVVSHRLLSTFPIALSNYHNGRSTTYEAKENRSRVFQGGISCGILQTCAGHLRGSDCGSSAWLRERMD